MNPLEYILRDIEKDDYFIALSLNQGLHLIFDRKKGAVPDNTLNLTENESRYKLPLKYTKFGFTKFLKQFEEMKEKEDWIGQGYIDDRIKFLTRLTEEFTEDVQDLYKKRVNEAYKIAEKFSELFPKIYEFDVKRLDVLGETAATAMREANTLLEELTEGKLSREYNDEIMLYSNLYLARSHLHQAAENFSSKLNEDSQFIKNKVDKNFAKKIEKIIPLYQGISNQAKQAKDKLQLLISQALFLYNVKLENIYVPHLGKIEKKLKDRLVDFNVPEQYKPYL